MFDSIHGVDFSGARLAGRTTWVARLQPADGAGPTLLTELARLEDLCGGAEREPALAFLVRLISRSQRALWALDFPFGLPIEVMPDGAGWTDQLAFLGAFGEDAYGVGEECLRRAKRLGGPNHIRRLTDREARAPFDCYHYRIIYQTFYGMRDVLGPLRRDRGTAVLPFQYARLGQARRVLVEACPASTLRRLGLPHQKYKSDRPPPLGLPFRRVRRRILDGLAAHVVIRPGQRRDLMGDPGGDALDAVLDAVGAAGAWKATDHDRVARHRRYPREGRLFF
jgi:hypothetical protein